MILKKFLSITAMTVLLCNVLFSSSSVAMDDYKYDFSALEKTIFAKSTTDKKNLKKSPGHVSDELPKQEFFNFDFSKLNLENLGTQQGNDQNNQEETMRQDMLKKQSEINKLVSIVDNCFKKQLKSFLNIGKKKAFGIISQRISSQFKSICTGDNGNMSKLFDNIANQPVDNNGKFFTQKFLLKNINMICSNGFLKYVYQQLSDNNIIVLKNELADLGVKFGQVCSNSTIDTNEYVKLVNKFNEVMKMKDNIKKLESIDLKEFSNKFSLGTVVLPCIAMFITNKSNILSLLNEMLSTFGNNNNNNDVIRIKFMINQVQNSNAQQ